MRTERQSNRWAPWWVYVLVIAPVNLGKQQLLPDDTAWWLVVTSTAATVLVGIAVITAVYRASTALGAPEGR
jgi:hypothetical protein